jgi:ubiquitin carboxyl-terminal hydrolase 7
MIFLKHFDPRKQTLLGVGKKYVGKGDRLADLRPIMNQDMGRPLSTPLTFYEVLDSLVIFVVR